MAAADRVSDMIVSLCLGYRINDQTGERFIQSHLEVGCCERGLPANRRATANHLSFPTGLNVKHLASSTYRKTLREKR